MRVLVVDDEEDLADAVQTALRRAAIAADVAYDGDAALAQLAVNDYDAVVLDRDLPGVPGDEVCRAIAARRLPARVLMLTAARRLDQKVAGFELGADDYLTKPFELPELIARLRALARRPSESAPPVLVAADIELDPFRVEVRRGGAARPGHPQGVRGAARADERPRRDRERGAAAGEGVGRERGPVHQLDPGHRLLAPQEAR